MRNTCRHWRNLTARPTFTTASSRWETGRCVPRFSCVDGRRNYFLMPLLKGAHDSFMSVVEIGSWLSGRQPLPLRSQPSLGDSATSRPNGSKSRSIQSSTPPQSWRVTRSIPPTANPDAETSLPEQLRSVMRLLQNPIVVCTANHNGIPRAMTMSSFTSVTLVPTPLVSFNIAVPSRTLDAITSSGEFNIHVLAGDAKGAVVADHFTRGNVDDAFQNIEGTRYTMGQEGSSAPLLEGEGILRVLRCKILRDGKNGSEEQGLIRVMDHMIVVGEVVEVIPGNKNVEFGLAYANRRYRQVGDVIEEEKSD